jgi:hypothetical protein
MPMARINILSLNEYKSNFNLESHSYNSRINPNRENSIQSLLDEIQQFELYLENKNSLLHKFPVGNSARTFFISLITCLVSTLGFLMIFTEIIFKREDSKEKIN